MDPDRYDAREVILRGYAHPDIECATRGTPQEAELLPVDALEQVATEAHEHCREALTTLSGSLAALSIRVRASRTILARRVGQPYRLSSVDFVFRAEVEGPRTRVPVLWQRSVLSYQLDRLLPDWLRALPETVLPELKAATSEELLEAEQELPLLLDPWLASQLIHECIGHTSEFDNYVGFRKETGMGLGDPWCEFPLQVYDDPTVPGARGGFLVDLDGITARRRQLVTDGVWTDLLVHEAAAAEAMLPAGNARRTIDAMSTLPRMSVTWAEGGDASIDDLCQGIERGLYCVGCWGGGSVNGRFLVRPAYGLWIEKGRISERTVRRFDVTGSKRAALATLAGASRDLTFFDPVGGCDRNGQDDLPVTSGAPHLLLARACVRPIGRTSRSPL